MIVAGTLRAAPPVSFGRDILPIFSDNCFHCHGPDEKARKGKLRLDVEIEALRAKDPVIVPGKSAASELVKRITSSKPDELMPPPDSRRHLTPAQVALLRRWVDEGARWGKHWAYEPPQRPSLPAVRQAQWPRNEVDRFILARLEDEKLAPATETSRELLARRVSLDLTGLPPTLEELDAFLADKTPDAYERLVDRLLASPRYGERMAWDWLEAARYADTNGYQGDGERTMWPWRDWVTRALNENLPFDQFTVWQLAGDLLPNATRDQKLATGFNRNHMINGEGGRIAEENRIEYIFDQTETLATVWLGITLTCARCHDHKFDPITLRDYYGLFAFFNGTSVDGGGGNAQSPPVLDFASEEQLRARTDTQQRATEAAASLAVLEEKLFPREKGKPAVDSPQAKELPEPLKDLLRQSPAQRKADKLDALSKHYQSTQPDYAKAVTALKAAFEARDAASKVGARVMVMEEMAKPRDTFILTRGTYNKPTDQKALPTFPASLVGTPKTPEPPARLNRLTLAQWLVAPEHPLTARITVNRAWQTFFGTGLVKTAEDFGVQGERPSHPELLDWLATEFVRTGWDVKRLHRLIVTSATYRQSSKITPALLERDPDNRLLSRGPRLRWPSWMLRDTALTLGGLLVEKRGGPSVKPYQPAGVWEEATFGTKSYTQDHGEALYRRSLYVFWRRIVGPTMFFDAPNRQYCTVRSALTNTPLHALVMLNDITYVEAARAMAQRLLTQPDKDDSAKLARAWRMATARMPSVQEMKLLRDALAQFRAEFVKDNAAALKLLKVGESLRDEKLAPAEHAAWMTLCSLLLNLDEVLTKQ